MRYLPGRRSPFAPPPPTVSVDAAIDRVTRVCFYLAAMILVALVGIHITGQNPVAVPIAYAMPTTPAITTWTRYSANVSEMGTLATNTNIMPQQFDNWCGVSNVTFINAYAYWQVGKSNPYPTESYIANLMNSPGAESPWGYPVGGGTFNANISRDLGTDPRALAWATYSATPYGYYYHNYIYNEGVLNATRNFASDYGSRGTNVPISVTIDGGAHSVVVGGVYANEDPSTNYNTVQFEYIMVYDPWYNSGFSPINYFNTSDVVMLQPYYDWWTMPKWWKGGYDTNNHYDPDPNTSPGNYYNVPPLPWHWGGNYVTVEQDNIPPGTYSVNIALDQTGSPVAHN